MGREPGKESEKKHKEPEEKTTRKQIMLKGWNADHKARTQRQEMKGHMLDLELWGCPNTERVTLDNDESKSTHMQDNHRTVRKIQNVK